AQLFRQQFKLQIGAMTMRHCFVSLVLTAVALSSTAWGAKPKSGGGAVVFVLDCSASMEQPAAVPSGFRQTSGDNPTRMEAAQSLLRKMLRDLVAAGSYDVGLWLYGHRLAWESGVQEPALLSQDEYLEATVGFQALGSLLPGDDVEKAQP